MGHIVYVEPGLDQGPLLNRVSMAMYTVAVAFVALRYVINSHAFAAYLTNSQLDASRAAISSRNLA